MWGVGLYRTIDTHIHKSHPADGTHKNIASQFKFETH